jgi:hypothetical protein
LKHEAVELGLGEGVGALLLEGVLGRHHEEGRGERVGRALDRHAALLHRLEQGGLGLGRRAVDLVGEDDLSEDRARLELELALDAPALSFRLDDDGRARDVGGHEVGGELDAAEVEVDGLAQRADQERLADARDTLEQGVPPGEQAGEHAVDDLGLPHHRSGDLVTDRGVVASERLRGGVYLFGGLRVAAGRCGLWVGHRSEG